MWREVHTALAMRNPLIPPRRVSFRPNPSQIPVPTAETTAATPVVLAGEISQGNIYGRFCVVVRVKVRSHTVMNTMDIQGIFAYEMRCHLRQRRTRAKTMLSGLGRPYRATLAVTHKTVVAHHFNDTRVDRVQRTIRRCVWTVGNRQLNAVHVDLANPHRHDHSIGVFLRTGSAMRRNAYQPTLATSASGVEIKKATIPCPRVPSVSR
jgi:hypothetical protein